MSVFAPKPKFNTTAYHRWLREINVYFYGTWYHSRRTKKIERNARERVCEAYWGGLEDGRYKRHENPYPPGRRYNEYERGYSEA